MTTGKRLRTIAARLGISRQGVARVRVRLLGPAPFADSGEIRLAQKAAGEQCIAAHAVNARYQHNRQENSHRNGKFVG